MSWAQISQNFSFILCKNGSSYSRINAVNENIVISISIRKSVVMMMMTMGMMVVVVLVNDDVTKLS